MVGVGDGVDVLCAGEGEVEEVPDLPQAILVALFGKVDATSAFQEPDISLYEVAYDHIFRSIKLDLAARDASIVVEMKFKGLVGIFPYERHAVHAFQFKVGKLAVQKARFLWQPEQGEKIVELVDKV